MAARLKEKYEQEIKPQLIERFNYTSSMQTPRLQKITLNMGLGEAKLNTSLLESASEQLALISGQKPSIRRARKSIANFKLRQGMPVGVKVTLRGDRMWEMLDRLESIAIPRIRDFRGLNPKSFDGRGNYSMGVKEQIIFPEIDYDSIDEIRGLDITITTSAKSDDEAFELLSLLGMPFRRDEPKKAKPAESKPMLAAAPEEAEAKVEADEQPAAKQGEASADAGAPAEAEQQPNDDASEGSEEQE